MIVDHDLEIEGLGGAADPPLREGLAVEHPIKDLSSTLNARFRCSVWWRFHIKR